MKWNADGADLAGLRGNIFMNTSALYRLMMNHQAHYLSPALSRLNEVELNDSSSPSTQRHKPH